MGSTSTYSIALIQTSVYLFIVGLCILGALLLSDTTRLTQHWTWFNPLLNFKNILLMLVTLLLLLTTLTLYAHHFTPHDSITNTITLWYNLVEISITDLSLVFLLLVSCLFIPVIILSDIEFSARAYKFFVLLFAIYFTIYLFILCNDLLVFFVLYELLIMLVFFVMYLSANTRGGIEATLFFLGWAVLGSMLVGTAVLYMIITAGSTSFSIIYNTTFTSDEIYFLYCLAFFGFGTKLSIWPFWYWLPRAHVEVSTALSVFLSCILIKVCLYGLMRVLWVLNSEVIVSPFIFFVALCTFDVTCRLIVQVDLKAVIAYGSVLHVNLLVALILLDTTYLSLGTVLYIWGHSYATAGLFFATHLIERCYGSRSTFEISGAYNTNPAIALIAVFAVITFLDFPLTFFFWGEVWLWITMFSVLPVTTAVLLFVSTVVYIIIFFRIWWGILFGASSQIAMYPVLTISWTDLYLAMYIIVIQYLWGVQPNFFGIFVVS